MSDFNYETYKKIKNNLITNVRKFSNLQQGQKLNFDPANGLFTTATNEERTQSNRNKAGADKQSATSLHYYKYPIIAFFYELNRIRLKRSIGSDVKNSQDIAIPQDITNCTAGLTKLKETYEGEQRRLLTKIFNSKTDQINNTRAILDVVNMMNQATTYAHLNTIYMKNVIFASPQRYVDMMAKVEADNDFKNIITEACTTGSIQNQYYHIGEAAEWLYTNVYSGGETELDIEIEDMRKYFIKLDKALRTNPHFNCLKIQNTELIFDPGMKHGPNPIFGYLYQFVGPGEAIDGKAIKGPINKQIANDANFKIRNFLHCWHDVRAGNSNCRLYANIKNTLEDHVGAIKALSEYLAKPGKDNNPRCSHVSYFKIASLNLKRDDTLCIYVDEYKTAMDWAAEIADKLKPYTNPTVAGFQGQPHKNIGVGIGAEPQIHQMNQKMTIKAYNSRSRYALRLSEHNTEKFLRAPRGFIEGNLIDPRGFSYGTYISSVLAVGLARAAKNNHNTIPALAKCTPYFAQTCAEYGIDYMKPHKPQEFIDTITKSEYTYGEDLLRDWRLQ